MEPFQPGRNGVTQSAEVRFAARHRRFGGGRRGAPSLAGGRADIWSPPRISTYNDVVFHEAIVLRTMLHEE
jgi:hypothetical protein